MSEFPAAGAIPVDATGLITSDIPCRKCGYDLRGLNQMGLCPECGTPAGLSINGDLLRYSDPAWLRSVAQGISLILWGILVGMIFSFLGRMLAPVSLIAPQLLGMIGGIMGLIGMWMMTAPDPSGIGEEGKLRARQIVRIVVAVGFGGQVLQLLAVIVSSTINIGLAMSITGIPLGILWIVGEFAKLTYIRHLALRIPDFKLAQSAHHIRWGYAIAMGVTMGAGALAVLIGFSGGGGMVVFAIFAVIAGLGFLVYSIMALILLFRTRKALLVQAQFATEIWAAQAPPPEVP